MNPEQCRQRVDGVWVCRECGFAYDVSASAVAGRLVDAAARVRQTLATIDRARLDTPARPGRWTPRVYLAHLTDWYEIIAERIERIVQEDRPILHGLDQDQLAIERDYAHWDVDRALDRFEAAAERSRRVIDGADATTWARVGVRDDLGEQGALPLSLFANDLIHELDHHLLDIQGVIVGASAGE